jgi:hypothetical protein
METKYFSLNSSENNRLVKAIQVIFGIVCFAVAIFWLIFNIGSLKIDVTLGVTILFLSGFGFYQVWSGLGKAKKFIRIGTDKIWLRKNIMLPAVELAAEEIEKIELFPLNLFIFLKSNKRILLRFGTTYHETNEKIIDAILIFAESNSINLEIKEEML